uniref:Uncharacterized protein n=1 Tax=Nelumbo nucifera TaxID=4432 RepID=A0A822YRN5_NELNU|nr:TPA_asm: hypothetical protein HUJ06_005820 [Nelumbo nucifera]
MYVARPLSMYRMQPSALSVPTPEAPYSGYLVITDEESEAQDRCCWGMYKNKQVRELPFPQNKILTIVHHSSGSEDHGSSSVDRHKLWQACRCSREAYVNTCCFCNFEKDVKPRILNYRDIYQQVEIHRRRGPDGGFVAKSASPDGYPPFFLKRKGWEAYASSIHHCQLSEALGLNISLRMRLPEFDFPMSSKRSGTVVVGKWYCPFVFIREKLKLKAQMKKSMFYQMTLEQFWEEIYTCDNDKNEVNVVKVNVSVQKEVAIIFGMEAMKDDTCGVDEVMWFRLLDHNKRGLSVGLSSAIVGKMRWLQETVGWVDGVETDVRVEKVEEFRGDGVWNKLGCYMLVERFALRRMDGSLLLTYDFRHTHHIQSRWE